MKINHWILGISHFQTNNHSFLINMGGFLTMGGFNYHGQVSEPFFIHLSLYPSVAGLWSVLFFTWDTTHTSWGQTLGVLFSHFGDTMGYLNTFFQRISLISPGKKQFFNHIWGWKSKKIWRLEHRFLWRFPIPMAQIFSDVHPNGQPMSKLWRNLPRKSTLQMQSVCSSDHNMNMICVSPKMNTSNTPPVF